MESYRFGSYDEAIEMLQKLKRQGKNKKQIIFTIDFDNNNSETRKMTTPDEGIHLVRKSRSIIINEDTFLPHMQLFSIEQTDLENIIRKGIMHDIILCSKGD